MGGWCSRVGDRGPAIPSSPMSDRRSPTPTGSCHANRQRFPSDSSDPSARPHSAVDASRMHSRVVQVTGLTIVIVAAVMSAVTRANIYRILHYQKRMGSLGSLAKTQWHWTDPPGEQCQLSPHMAKARGQQERRAWIYVSTAHAFYRGKRVGNQRAENVIPAGSFFSRDFPTSFPRSSPLPCRAGTTRNVSAG